VLTFASARLTGLVAWQASNCSTRQESSLKLGNADKACCTDQYLRSDN